MIKCETQRELWDLEDYEAIAPKIEHKPVTEPEYRSLGMQFFSPIDNKRQICEVLVTSQFNKDKSTIKVNEGQKMTEFTRTSTPKSNKVYPDCHQFKMLYTPQQCSLLSVNMLILVISVMLQS